MRLAGAGLLFLHLPAGAQTDSGRVYETARTERTVSLTMLSGPHPYTGDYPITVFLPPDYATQPNATYPVIYTFDAFDLHPYHDALWAENLIQPAILVAIGNKASQSRNYDLTPSVTDVNTGGIEVFADLITSELKVYVDRHFRTRREPASTGVMGNSYGGLAAFWLGYTRPGTFGMAACCEPSLWYNNNQLLNRVLYESTPRSATRFWIMAADQNYTHMWQNAKSAAHGLTLRGWREGEDVMFSQVHNMGHGSAAVRESARSMLHFLLRLAPPEPIRIELTNCHGPQLVPLRPVDLGGAAYAYLDVHYRHGLVTTAIAPALQIGDTGVVQVARSVLGELVPVGAGWTTVTTDFAGFHAVIDVQGILPGSPEMPPVRSAAPTIAVHPVSVTVAAGGDASLAVTAAGDGPYTYQWRKGTELIPGGTNAALTLAPAAPAMAGDYEVIVSNARGGSVLSRYAGVVIAAPSPGRLINLSVRSAAGATPLMVGFSAKQGSKQLLIRAVGPTLGTAFVVSGAMPDPRLEVHQRTDAVDRIIAANDDWAENAVERARLSALFPTLGAFPLPDESKDAALTLRFEGSCSAHAQGGATGAGGIILVEAYDCEPGAGARLVNLSARHQVGTGADVLIAGFVINGNSPKQVLLRGVGPTLAERFGVTGVLANPKLELHRVVQGRDITVATNDQWTDEPGVVDAAARMYAFPLGEGGADAALLVTLPAGSYTLQLSGADGGQGDGLIEVYEVFADANT